MRRRSFTWHALTLALTLGACAAPRPLAVAVAVPAEEARALALVNAHRRGAGLSALTLDAGLNAAAGAQARDMAARGRLHHDDFRARMSAAGFPRTSAAENVAYGQANAAEAVAGWRRSPEHDANLRLPGVARFGIGAATVPGSGRVYWAMVVAAEPGETAASR